jgi:hypothetical protein
MFKNGNRIKDKGKGGKGRGKGKSPALSSIIILIIWLSLCVQYYRVAAINPEFFLLSFKWHNTATNHPILWKKKIC